MDNALFGTILMEIFILILGVILGYGIFKLTRPFKL